MTAENQWDAIVIGAGHNGLIAAAYLARVGKRVLVVEKRDIVGGACVTEEVWPGYHVSTGAYLCSLLLPEIVAELNLAKYGLEIYRRETPGFAPFPDGRFLFVHSDVEQMRTELERFCAKSPQDIEAYFQFEHDIESVAQVIEPYMTASPPTDQTLDEAFEAAGLAALQASFLTGSVRALLEARFQSEELKAVLATDGLIGTFGGPSTQGTAYVLLHHYLGRILNSRGAWGYVRGGMGSITRALAQSAEEAGATLRTQAAVRRLITKDTKIGTQRVQGIELQTGEQLFAPIVLSNADPYHTFLQLLPQRNEAKTENREDSREENQERIAPTWERLKTCGGPAVKINLAVSQLPRFACLESGLSPATGVGRSQPGAEHLGTVHLCPNVDYLERAWEEARNGYPSTEPMIEMYMQTATDATLAPAGKHMVSLFVQYFPYNLAPGLELDRERERFAARVFAIVERYAPGFTASIDHCQVLTPRDLEARFGLTGGHIFHGDLLPPNLWQLRSGPEAHGATTMVEGLYLCGSGAHPGGCVYGAPGYNAAQAVLTQASVS